MSGFQTVTDRVGGVGGTMWTAGKVTEIYDSLDQRAINVKDPVFGAMGNGSTDDQAVLNSAAAAAAGGILFFPKPASYYRISAPIAIPDGTHVVLAPGVVIEQVTKYKPVFDCLDADDVTIDGNGALLRWTGSRAYTGGGAPVRGDDPYNYGAAVWSNGNRGTFLNLRISGFTAGVYLSPWNGSSLADYSKTGNVVENIAVDTCDFGLLFAGQVNLQFGTLRGTYTLQTSSGNPSHLIYGSDAADNRNVSGSDCAAYNGTGGHAYQFKNVDGGTIRGLAAYGCPGWLTMNGNRAVVFEGESHADAGNAENGSLYMQGTDVRCSVRFLVDLAASAKAARVDGTDCSAVIKGRVRRSTSSDSYDVSVHTTRNEADVDLVNLQDDGTDYTTGFRCVGLAGGSGHRAVVRRAWNTKYAATVASGITGCSVEVDPRQVQRSSSFSADSILSLVETATTRVAQPVRADTGTISTAGQSLRTDPASYNALHVTVNSADNFTIQAPYTGGAVRGMRYLVLIHNNSGGAMGTITWGPTLLTAWTNPAAGARKMIEFTYDGTTWRATA